MIRCNIRARRLLGSRMAQGSDVIARVSTQFRMRPPFTRLWDRIPRVLWDTLSDESFSPRQTDGELMVLMCLRHGTPEEARRFGGEPAVIFSRILYFNSLATAAAGRLPQPLSADDLADLRDNMWNLLHAASEGKPSGEKTALEAFWDHQDQVRRYLRNDPPPLQQPEFLKWRHWRPSRVREIEPTTQRALELHLRGKWAERLGPVCGRRPC